MLMKFAPLVQRPRSWCMALVALAAASNIAVAVAEMPALTMPPSAERHVGKVIWRELTSVDVPATKNFYGTLFGWTFDDVDGLGTAYSVARRDGRPVAGIIARTDDREKGQPAWLPYLSVSSVDTARALLLRRGGRSHRAPEDYQPRGRQAVATDPDGATFGLMDSHSADPPDELAEPGEWLWTSLLATHVADEIGFYQAVVGYEVFGLEATGSAEHAILATEDYARASVNGLPEGGSRHPHWLCFVRVVDVGKSAALARELGGRVVVEPRVDRHGSLFAVIVDPAGAPLGIMEWAAGDDPAVAK